MNRQQAGIYNFIIGLYDKSGRQRRVFQSSEIVFQALSEGFADATEVALALEYLVLSGRLEKKPGISEYLLKGKNPQSVPVKI